MDEDNKDALQSTTTKSPGSGNGGGGPIIQQSQESAEYQRALQTVVGTALGVILLVGLLALFFLIYRLRRQRRRARLLNGSSPHSPILNRSFSVDVGSKPVPSVLVLYAYDCAVHEAVVVALSGLLMEVCGVTVSLDAFEENVIMERGLEEWLEDRLQEADFIVVVCSLGARLRCSKKRVRFKDEPGRALPDYFAVAVDYVAEKLRVERSKGLGIEKFVCVVMDYSHLSDIPPQLEAASVFKLMRDFTTMCSRLTAASPHFHVKDSGDNGEDGDSWQRMEAGAELWAAIGQAKDYFKSHPNWLEDRIEPIPPRMRARPRRRRHDHEDQEQSMLPLLPLLPTDNVSNSSAINFDTSSSVVVHMNKLSAKPGGFFTHSRQNSLPSSLCSSHLQSGPAGTQLQQGVSRSVDSFPAPQPLGPDYGDDAACLVCQQQGWGGGSGRRVKCPIHPHPHAEPSFPTTHSDTDGDSELELGVEAGMEQRCSRSKSMPSVGMVPNAPHLHPVPLTTSQTMLEGFPNTSVSLSHSRTVLQAEVHKEWGAHRDGDAGGEGLKSKDNAPKEQIHIQTLQSVTDRVIEHDQDCKVSSHPLSVPLEGGVTRRQSGGVVRPQEVLRPPLDGGLTRLWGPDVRPTGRVSPSSLSSESSGSSLSDVLSGSDSLERDLKSFTMPRLFDHSAQHTFYPRMYNSAPPRSLSSSAVTSATDFRIRPVPCLTPVQLVNDYDFGISLAPLQFNDAE